MKIKDKSKEKKTKRLDNMLSNCADLAREVMEANGYDVDNFDNNPTIPKDWASSFSPEMVAAFNIFAGVAEVKTNIKYRDALTAAINMGIIVSFADSLALFLGKKPVKAQDCVSFNRSTFEGTTLH